MKIAISWQIIRKGCRKSVQIFTVQITDCSTIILLDLSAAFDTIDHYLLLNRLKVLAGIFGSALDWFSSYLSDRTYTIKTNNLTSDIGSLTCGVLQGSVLGPLLFSFYMLHLAGINITFLITSMPIIFSCICLLSLINWIGCPP